MRTLVGGHKVRVPAGLQRLSVLARSVETISRPYFEHRTGTVLKRVYVVGLKDDTSRIHWQVVLLVTATLAWALHVTQSAWRPLN